MNQVSASSRIIRFIAEFEQHNDRPPTNDEIVAALRTLQQAGISAPVMNNPYSDMSALFASSQNNNTRENYSH